MDHRTPEERTADVLESLRGEELGTLLADVRRMADGLDGIKELAVACSGRRPARTAIDGRPYVDEAITRIRRAATDASLSGAQALSVSVRELQLVLMKLDEFELNR